MTAAFEVGDELLAAGVAERDVASPAGHCLPRGLQVQIELVPRVLVHKPLHAHAQQLAPRHAQQGRRGEVGLADDAVRVQRYVAHGSKIVEIEVVVAGAGQLQLGRAKLFVLEFQFDLVDFEFVDRRLIVVAAPLPDGGMFALPAGFGLPAKRRGGGFEVVRVFWSYYRPISSITKSTMFGSCGPRSSRRALRRSRLRHAAAKSPSRTKS